MKHEIMWWMSRLTIMLTSLFLSMTLAAKAYAVDIQMGYEGNLVFEPSEVTISAGDTVTFTNAISNPIINATCCTISSGIGEISTTPTDDSQTGSKSSIGVATNRNGASADAAYVAVTVF